jgi:hypothetical protein
MATTGLDELVVVDRKTRKICGKVTLHDLLAGRRRAIDRENERVRVFSAHLPGERSAARR